MSATPFTSHPAPSSGTPLDPRLGACGKYRVLERLGQGGMGEVYLARDTVLGRRVALKFLPHHVGHHEAAQNRFLQEAIAASALHHANVATIYEIGESPAGEAFIAMEYCEGETLKQRLTRGPLPVAEAVDYALQIACGLQHAHEAEVETPDGRAHVGVVHRDIKPANVVITPDGTAKILDFGLAKVTDLTLTQTGATLGTALYMSPEQTQALPVDHRADLWAVGVVLYEMITSAPPFRGGYEQAIFYAISHDDPAPLPADVPGSVADVVRRCMEKRPADRYPHARALVEDLEAIKLAFAGDSPLPRVLNLRGARRRRMAGALVLLALLVGGAIGAALWFRPPSVYTLAILPFDVYGSDAHAQTMADGLHQLLTDGLGRVGRFQGKLSVLPAGTLPADISRDEARTRYNVTHFVSGSVQQDGDKVRLDARIEDIRRNTTVASKQITQLITSRFALQDSALAVVVTMLDVTLLPDEREMLFAGSTVNPDANRFYIQGIGLLRQSGIKVDDIAAAIGMFEAALEEDPRFALAEAGLAQAYWMRYSETSDPAWATPALGHSQRALALDPKLSDVHVTIGRSHIALREYDNAIRAFEQAQALDPANPEVYLGRGEAYRKANRLEEAEADYQRARRYLPTDWRVYFQLCLNRYYEARFNEALGRCSAGLAHYPRAVSLLNLKGAIFYNMQMEDSAIHYFEQTLTIDSTHANATENLATYYFYQRRYAEATRLYRRSLGWSRKQYVTQQNLADALYWIPGRRVEAREAYRQAIALAREHLELSEEHQDALGTLASSYGRLGAQDSSRMYLARLIASLPDGEAGGELAFGIGETYHQLGDRAQALRWMRRGLAQGGGWDRAHRSPWLDELRSDPAFQRMLASLE